MNHSDEPTSFSAAPPLHPPTDSPRPLFSTPILWVVCALGISTIAYQAWGYLSQSRLELLHYPAQTAALVAERMMEYEATPGPAPALEGWLALLLGSDAESLTNEAIRICRSVFDSPRVSNVAEEDASGLVVVLGTILGESGRTNELRALLEDRKSHRQELELLRRLYLSREPVPLSMESRLPHTGVIGEWTRDRLEARAALVAGLPSSGVAPEILQRSASAHLRELALTAFTVVLLLSGVGATVFLLRARNGFAEPATQLSAPWRWRDLFGVLMAAQFLGLFLYLGIGMGTSDFVRTLNDRVYIASPLLVLLALTAWLFRRSGLSLAQTFAAGAWKAALSGALALFTFNLLGAVVLFHAFERFGADTEWAESIDEWMIYGSNLDRFVLLLNMAVLAPIYEELQMRRLLHATLRRRLPVLAAAVLSATAFAALHFYSFTGFLAVWWFGFCAALVYERTRSLLACIVGHGLVNVVLGLWDWSSYSVG